MLTSNRFAAILAILSLSALPMLTTGCASANTQSALSSLRGFATATHPAAFAIAATKHSVAIHRHPREHALPSMRAGVTLHHQSARTL